VNNTLALAIVSFLCVEFWGFQALGAGYLKKFFNLNGIMSFVGILELLSEFIRVISFAFRLFGNIFAGEVLILMLTFLMPFLFVDIIYGLELFVGFIQAAVFRHADARLCGGRGRNTTEMRNTTTVMKAVRPTLTTPRIPKLGQSRLTRACSQ